MSSNFPIHHGIKVASGGYIVNAVIESLVSDPSPIGDIGRIWFNSSENVYKQAVDNGSGGVAIKVFATVDQIESLQDELDATQTGAGLGSDGSYSANGEADYIASAVSLKDADDKLDAALKAEEEARIAADGDLQDELDATQTGAGLGSDGSYSANGVSNYIASATSLKSADDALDSALKGVDDRLADVEDTYINKDGSVAFIGDVDMGANRLTNLAAPVEGTDATTKTYVDDEIAIVQAAVDALGNAFNYVGVVTGGTEVAPLDMLSLEQKDSGDYYKVSTAGWFVVGEGTAFFANVGDGLVFNLVGGVDKIDNTDSTVSGTTDFITVTGSADTGYTVDVASAFKTRVSDLETDLGQEIQDRQDADDALQDAIITVKVSVGLGVDGSYVVPTTSNYINSTTSIAGAISALDVALKAEEDARIAAAGDLQDELDATQTGAGLDTDGSYIANAEADYISSATSLAGADDLLDAALKAEEEARIAADGDLQDELDATQTGAGLGSDGSYTADNTTNYLTEATSLKGADKVLDGKIKAFLDAYNSNHFFEEKSTAATEHTITHGLGTTKLTFTVMIDRDGNGDWRNDVVSVKHTDNNTLTVYLSVAKKIRVSVQKIDNISI